MRIALVTTALLVGFTTIAHAQTRTAVPPTASPQAATSPIASPEAPASPTTSPRAEASPTTSPDTADQAAVEKIVMGSVAEMQLCDLAAEKTQNPDIRSFCRRAVNDHARTAIAGMQVAQSLGDRDLRLTPSPGTPAVIDTLTQYSGHEFDREFLLAQIEDHENDRETLRFAVETTTNVSVKRYEDSVLPRVEKYLLLAESTLNAVSAEQP